jgi:predicted amidohydrolase YtcJ
MSISITRKDRDGAVYSPKQAVSREEALRLYAGAASRYAFAEQHTGTIDVGKLADLAILSVDEDEIKNIVALKIVGGRVVYERAS